MISEPKPFIAWAATHMFTDRKPAIEQVQGSTLRTTPGRETDAQSITH
jgi:hypothetical protein